MLQDLGKFLNGYNQLNYNKTPQGWDNIDALAQVDPNPKTAEASQRHAPGGQVVRTELLQPNDGQCGTIRSLKQALDPRYDDFFASFPKVHVPECLQIQDVENERPFYPSSIEADSKTGLGRDYRGSTANYVSTGDGGLAHLQGTDLFGTWEQRNASLEDNLKSVRKLTSTLPDHGTYGKESK
ncbi:hypothetical protein BDW62DRAFT_203954 [Aspergillus aurantiobrunneus]